MWRIAAPMIISNISIPLVGITDTIITGYLDNSEFIASIAVASAIIGFFIASMNFLRMGTTGITAQRFGAGDFNGSRVVLYQALILAIAFSLIILLFQIQINAFGQFLIGANESVKYFASEYFHMRIWGMPATLVNFVLIGWFIGMQDAKTPNYCKADRKPISVCSFFNFLTYFLAFFKCFQFHFTCCRLLFVFKTYNLRIFNYYHILSRVITNLISL